MVLSKPGRADIASAGLDAGVEASGPHDFAVRSNISRQHAIDRSQATARPAITSRAQRCRVHRIPPRVRDDRASAPLWGGTHPPYSCFYQTVKLPIRIRTHAFENELRIDEALVWSGRSLL